MTTTSWGRWGLRPLRTRAALVLALFLTCHDRLPAAAGISDIAATRACWLQPPYALSKCYSRGHAGGPYPANLFLGRPSRPGDSWAYEGIVHVQYVDSNISRIAVTPRYIIVEHAGSGPSFGIIDHRAGSVNPVTARSWAEVRRHLSEHGEEDVEVRLQTFEEVYRERGPWWGRYGCLGWLVCPAAWWLSFASAAVLAAALSWRRKRLRTSREVPP